VATIREARSNVNQGKRKRKSRVVFQSPPDRATGVEAQRIAAAHSAQISLESAEESNGFAHC